MTTINGVSGRFDQHPTATQLVDTLNPEVKQLEEQEAAADAAKREQDVQTRSKEHPEQAAALEAQAQAADAAEQQRIDDGLPPHPTPTQLTANDKAALETSPAPAHLHWPPC